MDKQTVDAQTINTKKTTLDEYQEYLQIELRGPVPNYNWVYGGLDLGGSKKCI